MHWTLGGMLISLSPLPAKHQREISLIGPFISIAYSYLHT